jgi:hypothetical protein
MMPDLGILERYREIVKNHKNDTDGPISPDLCDLCFMIYQYEDLLKECQQWHSQVTELHAKFHPYD